MSSKKYASPLRFKIIPSRILFVWITVMHLGAILLLLPASLPVGFVIAGSLLLFLSLSIHWCRLRGNIRLLSLGTIWPVFTEGVWDDADRWHLLSEHQQSYLAHLMSSTFVSSRLVVINLRLEKQAWYCRYRSVVLLPDNIDTETFRRLRIRLRWYSSQVQDNWVASK